MFGLFVGGLFGVSVWTLVSWCRERDVSEEVRPDEVHWSSPIDFEWMEAPLPEGVHEDDVWATLAWIGRLPEVAHA